MPRLRTDYAATIAADIAAELPLRHATIRDTHS